MIYTRRVGEYEETFEGTAEEVAQVLNAVDAKELHDAAAKITPAPTIMVTANCLNEQDVQAISKQLEEVVGKVTLNSKVFDELRDALT